MRIQILSTGGTIDKIYFDAKSEYEVGAPQIEEILGEANVTFDYRVQSVLKKDSLDLTDADRAIIRQAVQESTCDRILVTHGTDTMIQTALALRGLQGKTVVLTGSMQPARFRNTDAGFNVGFAIGALQSLSPGIYIAMNGRIFAPEGLHKNREKHRFEQAQ